jgi:predicted ATPase
MKNLTFLDISLLSTVEKKARSFEFHPKSNLIVGMNHTGKSTLTKMLFETLGAYPSGKLDGWDKGIISSVTLLIDGVKFKVVRQG